MGFAYYSGLQCASRDRLVAPKALMSAHQFNHQKCDLVTESLQI